MPQKLFHHLFEILFLVLGIFSSVSALIYFFFVFSTDPFHAFIRKANCVKHSFIGLIKKNSPFILSYQVTQIKRVFAYKNLYKTMDLDYKNTVILYLICSLNILINIAELWPSWLPILGSQEELPLLHFTS